MRTHCRIIRGGDFIKAKPTGEIDLERSKKLLGEIAEIAGSPAEYEILLDVRDARSKLTHTELYEFVAELGRRRSAFRNKIAVLCRQDEQLNRVRFMQLCATNRGFEVDAFTDYEQAMEWIQPSVEVAP